MKRILLALFILSINTLCYAAPHVTFNTTLGDIEIELYPKEAPITVKNFIAYVESGFYNDTIFHRVIPDFVVQGGGFTTKSTSDNTSSFVGWLVSLFNTSTPSREMHEKLNNPPIKNEADNKLVNLRGTLSMARTDDINSATSQFFINLKDNPPLDHNAQSFGYAVFAKVVKGMEIVDKMAQQPTSSLGMYDDVPKTPIVITKATYTQ